MTPDPDISVVVPVYGCCSTLSELLSRLASTFSESERSYEVILVDDRSPDDTWTRIEELAQINSHLVGLRLSRNFGQHAAIAAGLEQARGQKVIVMDCDLQDPPEVIPELLEHANNHDVVTARRLGNYQHLSRRLVARVYARVFQLFSGIPVDPAEGSFSVLDRKVVDAFLMLKERNGHYLMVLRWLGFSQISVSYLRSRRKGSVSSYSLRRQLRHGLDGMMFHSTRVLNLVVAFGFMIALVGVAFASFAIYQKATGQVVAGWTSLVTIFAMFAGSIITIQGVIGVYVSNMFVEVKRRPRYVIAEQVGCLNGEDRPERDPGGNLH